jgi:hypothetical protein
MTHVRCTAQVPTFNNIGNDSSPDVCESPSPKKTGEKCSFPPPQASGKFLRFSFALLPRALMTILQVLTGFGLCWI